MDLQGILYRTIRSSVRHNRIDISGRYRMPAASEVEVIVTQRVEDSVTRVVKLISPNNCQWSSGKNHSHSVWSAMEA